MSTLSRLIGTTALTGLGIVPALSAAPTHAAASVSRSGLPTNCHMTESVSHEWTTWSWFTVVGTMDVRAKGGACVTPTSISIAAGIRVGGSTAADPTRQIIDLATSAAKNLVYASAEAKVYNTATGKVLRSASWSSTDLLPKLRKAAKAYTWSGPTKQVTFTTPLPAGTYIVQVSFTADFNNDGKGHLTRTASFSYVAA